MPMRRTDKARYIEELHGRIAQADWAVLGVNQGMKVAEIDELRRKLEKSALIVKVAKNTLLRRAAAGTPLEVLQKHFKGSTVLIAAKDDPLAPSKALRDFLKTAKTFGIKAAMLSGREIPVTQIEALASMPAREELLARLMGTWQAPLSNLMGLTRNVTGQFLGTLEALREKREKEAA